jgi:hypothetical protein
MASKYIQKFPIPQDFPNILRDLAKEVLRYQPEDIIEFSALYFKCLQEGKELDYTKKGTNIPCDFKNVIPGNQSENVRTRPLDKSNVDAAVNKAHQLSGQTNENDKKDPYKDEKIKNNDNEQPVNSKIINMNNPAKAKEVQQPLPVNNNDLDLQMSIQSNLSQENILRISQNFTSEVLGDDLTNNKSRKNSIMDN